jgi:hypothetical protein
MKRFYQLIAVLALVALAVPAFSGSPTVSKIPFVNASSASGGVETSAIYNVTGYRTKTLHVSGVTLTSTVAAPVFQNMSGTFIAECSPTGGNPWSTCVANDYGQTVVSKTTNGNMTWQDTSPYVRFKWTAGTVGTKIKAWFTYLDN